jgi:hypothetical protein
MKNQSPIVGAAILIIAIALSGCNGEQNNVQLEGELDSALYGTWLFSEPGREFTWTLNSDGSFIYNEQPGTWSTNNGKILLLYENTQTIISLNYSLTNNGTVLSTSDEFNHIMEYTKQ